MPEGEEPTVDASKMQPAHPAEWFVPKAEYYVFAPKRTNIAVVVPVINEGVKIIDQLTRMQSLGVMRDFDVFLTDGGSTDGSTEISRLKDLGLRGLFVKRDRGKLSAQLQIAYAFTLHDGYSGVVTIDGNGKDSIESIAAIAKALEDGFDYVQGSRFIPGGKAIRTPLIRLLAIRLLHAPIISITAGTRLTDTTNGFRGYSSQYLLHPAVQPFRPIFQTYELLAYLSARASQLKMKVTEVPVTREYPAHGPVPTKISGMRGYINLLEILWRLACDEYTPTKVPHE